MDVVAIDWSGAARARHQAALAHSRDNELVDVRSGLSREEAVEAVIGLAGSSEAPLVVGIDFAFSLPAWFIDSLGVTSARQLWELVGRVGEEWLEACEPPFWGRPGTMRPDLEEHFRRTEASLPAVAGIGVKSPFQIGGAGSVGTSTLRGMPFLPRLQDAGFSIWPFDAPAFPLLVEIYPRLLTGPVTKSDRAARDLYLRGLRGIALPAALAEAAAESEDTFDAAVSAIVMSENAAELADLAAIDDPVIRLEGQIWAPSSPAGPPRAAGLLRPPVEHELDLDSRPRPAPAAGGAYGVRYSAALGYAAELHAGQVRKGTGVPYVSHLLGVSAYVWEAGGDEDQAIAGLLHDAVEDQGGPPTLELIRRRFGERVAGIVDVCTDADEIPKPPWRARKEAHIARISSAPVEALVVVAADKLHNARTIVADVRLHGPAIWDRFKGGREGTLWYYEQMLAVLSERVPECSLVPQLAGAVREMAALAGE